MDNYEISPTDLIQHFWTLYSKMFSNVISGDFVRCMGRLIGQTGRFRIMKIGKIDLDDEVALIRRLEAICSFEVSRSPKKAKNWLFLMVNKLKKLKKMKKNLDHYHQFVLVNIKHHQNSFISNEPSQNIPWVKFSNIQRSQTSHQLFSTFFLFFSIN